ncbi:YceI family protein [Lacinutrix sp. Hel_I_90]|uniref:YceI family protein n=1 Tax=Lacinutrix sp. Hel_I_90 TaxID=1249999 RepID=UPI0005C9DE4C|nr:YceI family protein [Lacinutrix sp. Hel_I_90]
MKNLALVLFALVSSLTFSQEKYLTKTGTVTFEASVPSFEEVKAENKSTTAILNTKNGEFAALVLVKGFRFKNALMEEHFNENYAESDDFPKATFKGTLVGFSIEKLASKTKMTYNGSLSFHGKTKQLENQTLTIYQTPDGQILLSGKFIANVSDFDIEIPSVVSNKLSKEVDVSFSFELDKK